MSTMIQNVCVCFTTTRRCILCSGYLSWISVSPIFHQIGLYLNSSEWSSFANAHSAQFNLSFITSVFSSTVTEWQLAMELVINYIAHMLSDISLPSALQISSYQEKKNWLSKSEQFQINVIAYIYIITQKNLTSCIARVYSLLPMLYLSALQKQWCINLETKGRIMRSYQKRKLDVIFCSILWIRVW